MGNTTSTANVVQQNNQLFVNKDYVKSVSEQLNSQISNTLIKNAKACTADINNNQAINIKGFTTKGDFNFTGNQTQSAALTFSCVQSTKVRNTAGSEIISNMTSALQNNVNNEALAKMDANAKNAASSSFGAIGNTQANTNINAINNYQSVTENHKDIENVVKNVVQNNFSSESISNCISQVNNNQSINLQEVNVAGKAVIAIDQNQAANVVAECIQNDNVGNAIMNAAASALGVKIEDKTVSKSIQESKSEVVQEAHMAGYLEGLAGIIGSIGTAVSSIFDSPGMMITCIGICCLLCIVLAVGGYFISNNPEVLMAL
jgi:hypothetical protein